MTLTGKYLYIDPELYKKSEKQERSQNIFNDSREFFRAILQHLPLMIRVSKKKGGSYNGYILCIGCDKKSGMILGIFLNYFLKCKKT